MKITGKVKIVLPERNEIMPDGTSIRKKSFILEVKKPSGSTDGDRDPDTIALQLVKDKIDKFPISQGDYITCLYDSNARVNGEGIEAFDRKSVFRIYEEEDND